MSWLRSKVSVCLLSCSFAIALGTPGCGGLANFFLKLLIQVGQNVAASYVGKFVEEKLDSWVFNKNSTENNGGDVAANSDGLSGTYNGSMEITVTGAGGKNSVVKVSSPRMVRDSTSSSWKLDPSIIQLAKQRTEEKFGK